MADFIPPELTVSKLTDTTQRGDNVLAKLAKAVAKSHFACEVIQDGRNPINILAGYVSAMRVVRGDISEIIECVSGQIGKPEQPFTPPPLPVFPPAVITPPPVPAFPPAQVFATIPPPPPVPAGVMPSPLPLTQKDKLAIVCEILGETTNAQMQQWAGTDSEGARKIIDELVRDGVIHKASTKLYKYGKGP